MTTPLLVKEPSALDVLCGQDANYGLHTGNKILRKQIDLVLPSYRQTNDRREKIARIDEIITFMRIHYKSRFLKPRPQPDANGETVWEEVSEQSVRDKVSHALRFAARRLEQGSSTTKKPRRNKSKQAKRGSKSKKAAKEAAAAATAKEASASSSAANSDDETEELDEASKIRLAWLHKRQLEILEELLKQDDESVNDEDSSTTNFSSSTSVSSASATTARRTSSTSGIVANTTTSYGALQEEDDDFWRDMMADVEPIPIDVPSSSTTTTASAVDQRNSPKIPDKIEGVPSMPDASLLDSQSFAQHHHHQQQPVPPITSAAPAASSSLQLLPPLYNPNTYGYHSFDMSPHYLFPPYPYARAAYARAAFIPPNTAPQGRGGATSSSSSGNNNNRTNAAGNTESSAPGSASLGPFVRNLRFF